MSQAIVAIDSDGYTLKLKEEGLSDIELDFKYSLFDQILVRTGLPVTLNEYNTEDISPTGQASI